MESQAVTAKRRRLRISVRTLMLLIFGLAAWLGWRVNLARTQREAVAAIEAHGGFVAYNWEFVNDKRVPGRSPNAPGWLRKQLGDAFFQDVVQVAFSRRVP